MNKKPLLHMLTLTHLASDLNFGPKSPVVSESCLNLKFSTAVCCWKHFYMFSSVWVASLEKVSV